MEYRLLHGPERSSVSIVRGGFDPNSAAQPFHGIISRGLFGHLNKLPDGPSQWVQVAPFLEPSLALLSGPKARYLGPWRRAARRCRVLTYAQSALCARFFVQSHAAEIARRLGVTCTPEQFKELELWSTKEGHTASIWKATLWIFGQEAPVEFALNVARDAEAGNELISTSNHLRGLHALDPDGVAEVLAVDSVKLRQGKSAWKVPVVATRWLDQARELHVLSNPDSGMGQFVLVERFACSPETPGRIQAIIGIRLDIKVSDAIWAAILKRMVLYSEFHDSGRSVRMPVTQINEGDWVWNGNSVQLVGLSDQHLQLPLGEWVLNLLLPFAGQGGGKSEKRLYWGNPQAGLNAFSAAVAGCGLSVATCLRAVTQACEFEINTLSPNADQLRVKLLKTVSRLVQNY